MHLSHRSFAPFAGFLAAALLAVPANAVRAESGAGNVQAVDGKALKRAIEEQKGKVVVVNYWATWCAPCVEEFPDLVKLQNSYRDKGLVVIGVSMDEPDDKGKVVAFVD